MQNYRYFLSFMVSPAKNLNLSRRPLPGLLVRLATPLLKPLLYGLRTRGDSVPTVYASYMVGDFFMALPALLWLKKSVASRPLRVLCRPDCVELLAREGIEAVAMRDSFRVTPGVRAFARTWRAAWSLRARLGDEVLDLDADPRTAFWLKIAGVRRTVSYRRASGSLFDVTFVLPNDSVHQADRDQRVVEEWAKRGGGAPHEIQPPTDYRQAPANAPWILSVWTRKPSKNWSLKNWDVVLEKLASENIPFVLLEAPDGDAAFQEFRNKWKGRAPVLRGSLTEIADAVRGCAGVLATDNFLGHMAGYYGKPVLWINISSPQEQVVPRGPRTIALRRPTPDEAWGAFQNLLRA